MTVTATADKTIILPNQSVTFTVTASSDEHIFDSVYLYINGVKGADVNTGYGNKSLTYTHTFSSTGTYEVKFYHQNGGKYSNTVTVYVSTYAIEFEEASYHSCGSCTVSCVLTDNGVVMSGETVSLTGTGSTLTATTDSNGVATFNLTGISASATLTASYSVVYDTASLTYTNPNTLNGSLVCLGRRMASHLTTMGVVDADPSDGLTTLADKILDVEPSISGLDLETEITASASSTSIDVGDTVTFTGILSAYYDDETVTDVDLQGVLQGATVLIKEGSTTLASGTTDTTGAYSITNTFSTSGTHTVKAVFEGTDNFKDCESSSITIDVASITPVPTTITLTGDKSIISYADSESCTLTSTVLDQFSQPVSGETVSFDIVGGDNIGTATTNASGVATVSYLGQGSGDIYIQASCSSILSQTYAVKDCVLYDSCTSDSGHWNTSQKGNASVSFSSSGLAFNNSSDSTNRFLILDITYPSTFSVEYEIVSLSPSNGNCGEGMVEGISTIINSSKTTVYDIDNWNARSELSPMLKAGDIVRYDFDGSNVSAYLNGTFLASKPKNSNHTGFRLKAYKGRGITLRNLKIKPL